MAHAVMTNFILQFCVGLLGFCYVADCAALGLQKKCPTGSFYDDVLRKCESCYAVCHEAQLQRTEDKCALCKDVPKVEPKEDSHTSSSDTTVPILVVWFVIAFVILTLVGIFITAVINRRRLQHLCQRLQASLSREDIRVDGHRRDRERRSSEGGEDDDQVPSTAMLIVNPSHDPQNKDYQQQQEVDLKLVRSSPKNVHAELLDSIKMAPAGLDIQETSLKTV